MKLITVGIDDILLEKFDKLWWVEIPTFSKLE
jgi:hypothetical protein